VSGKSPAQFRVDFCGRRIDASHILEFDRMINAWHPSSETSKRLDKILGVGPTLASTTLADLVYAAILCRDFFGSAGIAEAVA
jgi:transposase